MPSIVFFAHLTYLARSEIFCSGFLCFLSSAVLCFITHFVASISMVGANDKGTVAVETDGHETFKILDHRTVLQECLQNALCETDLALASTILASRLQPDICSDLLEKCYVAWCSSDAKERNIGWTLLVVHGSMEFCQHEEVRNILRENRKKTGKGMKSIICGVGFEALNPFLHKNIRKF